ncbi:MAG: hypothetical protein AAB654_13400 [Acidobacteriota bacterium]
MIAAAATVAWLLLPLPAPAAEQLKVDFVSNKTRDGGELVLTHPGLSAELFPQDKTGTAVVEVIELKPNVPGVLESKSASYEIRGGRLTARVPFNRSRGQAVAFKLIVYIPDKKGTEVPFVASDSIGPVRAEVSPEQKKPGDARRAEQEQETAKTGTAALKLSEAIPVEVRSLERVSVALTANRKAPIKILIRDAKTGEALLKQKAEVDVTRKTFTLDIPAAPNLLLAVLDEEEKILHEVPLQSEIWRLLDRVRALISVIFGLLLTVVLVAVVLELRRWLQKPRRKKEQEPAVPEVGSSLDEIRSRLQDAIGRAESAFSTASSAMQTANLAQRAVEQLPRALDETAVREVVTASLECRLGSDSAMGSLVAAAGPPRGASLSVPSDPEQFLLAAVNYWLESRSRDRAELVRLVEALGVRAQLYAHKNLTRLFSDITKFVYEFEPSERDGGWLWVAGPETGDFLIVPTDAAFFQVGKAPDLLDRLFEGMQRAGDVFQFRGIFRACRVRRSPDGAGYTLEKKGCLQLEGEPAPNLPLPPPYFDLRAHAAPPLAGQPLAETLRDAFLRSSEGLQRTQAILEDVRQQLAQARKQPAAQAGIDELRQQLTQAQRQTTDQVAKLSEIEAALVALRGKLEELPSRPATAPVAAAPGESLAVKALRHQLDARISALETELLKLMERFDDDVARLGTEARAEGESLPKPGEEAVAAAGGQPAPARAAEAGKLPKAWREALRTAADRSVPPSPSERVSKAVFLRRLTELAQALSELGDPAASPVEVVHLKVKGEEFEIHETEPIPQNPDERMCKRCQVPHCFQLAVCAGAADEEAVSLLYPLGVLVPSNYPAGYINLVASLPATPFLIGDILQPARLELVPRDVGAAYRVRQKLQWSPG